MTARNRPGSILAFALILAGTGAAHAAVCLVSADGTSGTTDLQTALGDTNCTELWVTKGVYKPGTSQNDRFNIRPGLAVYGGFAGGETVRDQRDPVLNVTVLSGDIDNNDTNTDGSGIDQTSADIAGSNTHHIVFMDGTTAAGNIIATTVLDGFTLTGGDNSNNSDGGGALWCLGFNPGNECSPTLTNLVFCGNKAQFGGAMYIDSSVLGISNPHLTYVTFSGNSASVEGGAMYNYGGNSNPTLTNVTFSDNNADDGGAMYNDGLSGKSNPALTNVTFNGNSALYGGGAMYNDGEDYSVSSPTLANVTFSDNNADYGGAMYNNGESNGTSSPTLANVTFSDNNADYGGAMYNDGDSNGTSNPTLSNAIMWGDSAPSGAEIFDDVGDGGFISTAEADPIINYSIVQGGSAGTARSDSFTDSAFDAGTGNRDADPVLGALANNGGFTLTMVPGADSSAIDNGTCPGDPTTDQRGVSRPQDGNRDGTSVCDIGAVEVPKTCRVKADASGSNSGNSWTNAYKDLQSALQDSSCREVWVAAGVYKPAADASDRSASFRIDRALALYGGFSGSETTRDQRDASVNTTVLSGDLDGDDINTDGNGISETANQTRNNNSYHVVSIDAGSGSGVAMDGFVVSSGRASGGDSDPTGYGAGLYLLSGNVVMHDLRIVGNRAYLGGGLYLDNISPNLEGVTVSNNFAVVSGGGLHCNGRGGGHTCSPALANVAFSGNTTGASGSGGAMFDDGENGGMSSPTLSNVTFSGNSAASEGGAMYNYGYEGTSSPTLTNVTFSGNSVGGSGGAMFNYGYEGTSRPTLTNVTFSGNSAVEGGAMFNFLISDVSPKLSNIILWGDTATSSDPEISNLLATSKIDHSVVQGGCPSGSTCTNLVNIDPLLGALANNGGFAQTLLPGAGSSAIDAGTCAGVPATDQRGIPRPQDGNGDGISACDIGAVEYSVVDDTIFADGFESTP